MTAYRLYQIDAFTLRRFTGNPAGVVPDARGLADAAMQAIAREVNASETAFIFPEPGLDYDMTVRFFTPTTEVPICGHATIAAHWVRALEGAPEGMVRQKTAAGVLPVEIERIEGAVRIWMTQAPATFEPPLAQAVQDDIRVALGLGAADHLEIAPMQVVSTGHSKVMIPLTSIDTLHGLAPDFPALTRLSRRIGSNGFYPFAMAQPNEAVLAHGRMFAPAIGIAEDPVTGNASGPLGAYLARHGLLHVPDDNALRFNVAQGQTIGRSGVVLVEVGRAGKTFSIRVAGQAVAAFQTTIEVAS